MYVCMYACMHVCMYANANANANANIYISIYILCICANLCKYMCISLYLHIFVYMFILWLIFKRHLDALLRLERFTSHSPLAGGYGQMKRRDTHNGERMQRKNACKNKHYGIPEWHVFRVMLVIWGGGGFLKSISQKRVPPRPTLSQGLQLLTHRIKQRLNDCGLFFD